MRKVLNGITKIYGVLVVLFLVVLIIAVLFPLIPPFRGYFHTRTVQTGSMAPTIPTGSLIINHYTKDRDLAIGDIVTYKKLDSHSPVFITHRIISIDKSGLLYRFQTEGDANTTPDTSKINQANIEGKVIAVIPYLGHLVDLLKTPIVFVILVFLPLCLFVLRQLRDAWKIWQEMSLRKDKKNTDYSSQKIILLTILLFFLQNTVMQKVYASFRSSPVKITAITLATISAETPTSTNTPPVTPTVTPTPTQTPLPPLPPGCRYILPTLPPLPTTQPVNGIQPPSALPLVPTLPPFPALPLIDCTLPIPPAFPTLPPFLALPPLPILSILETPTSETTIVPTVTPTITIQPQETPTPSLIETLTPTPGE